MATRGRRAPLTPSSPCFCCFSIKAARWAGEAVGWVGYWERTWRGDQVYEIGWSVLPAFQGKGIAAAATLQAIAAARAEGTHRFLHAYPSVDNAASNAICRKLGFTSLGQCDFEHPPGHFMQCNDWRFDLRAA